ncbi:MAG: hypothetical protein ACRCXZ_07685 [Patescibacteria group bacterium]
MLDRFKKNRSQSEQQQNLKKNLIEAASKALGAAKNEKEAFIDERISEGGYSAHIHNLRKEDKPGFFKRVSNIATSLRATFRRDEETNSDSLNKANLKLMNRDVYDDIVKLSEIMFSPSVNPQKITELKNKILTRIISVIPLELQGSDNYKSLVRFVEEFLNYDEESEQDYTHNLKNLLSNSNDTHHLETIRATKDKNKGKLITAVTGIITKGINYGMGPLSVLLTGGVDTYAKVKSDQMVAVNKIERSLESNKLSINEYIDRANSLLQEAQTFFYNPESRAGSNSDGFINNANTLMFEIVSYVKEMEKSIEEDNTSTLSPTTYYKYQALKTNLAEYTRALKSEQIIEDPEDILSSRFSLTDLYDLIGSQKTYNNDNQKTIVTIRQATAANEGVYVTFQNDRAKKIVDLDDTSVQQKKEAIDKSVNWKNVLPTYLLSVTAGYFAVRARAFDSLANIDTLKGEQLIGVENNIMRLQSYIENEARQKLTGEVIPGYAEAFFDTESMAKEFAQNAVQMQSEYLQQTVGQEAFLDQFNISKDLGTLGNKVNSEMISYAQESFQQSRAFDFGKGFEKTISKVAEHQGFFNKIVPAVAPFLSALAQYIPKPKTSSRYQSENGIRSKDVRINQSLIRLRRQNNQGAAAAASTPDTSGTASAAASTPDTSGTASAAASTPDTSGTASAAASTPDTSGDSGMKGVLGDPWDENLDKNEALTELKDFSSNLTNFFNNSDFNNPLDINKFNIEILIPIQTKSKSSSEFQYFYDQLTSAFSFENSGPEYKLNILLSNLRANQEELNTYIAYLNDQKNNSQNIYAPIDENAKLIAKTLLELQSKLDEIDNSNTITPFDAYLQRYAELNSSAPPTKLKPIPKPKLVIPPPTKPDPKETPKPEIISKEVNSFRKSFEKNTYNFLKYAVKFNFDTKKFESNFSSNEALEFIEKLNNYISDQDNTRLLDNQSFIDSMSVLNKYDNRVISEFISKYSIKNINFNPDEQKLDFNLKPTKNAKLSDSNLKEYTEAIRVNSSDEKMIKSFGQIFGTSSDVNYILMSYLLGNFDSNPVQEEGGNNSELLQSFLNNWKEKKTYTGKNLRPGFPFWREVDPNKIVYRMKLSEKVSVSFLWEDGVIEVDKITPKNLAKNYKVAAKDALKNLKASNPTENSNLAPIVLQEEFIAEFTLEEIPNSNPKSYEYICLTDQEKLTPDQKNRITDQLQILNLKLNQERKQELVDKFHNLIKNSLNSKEFESKIKIQVDNGADYKTLEEFFNLEDFNASKYSVSFEDSKGNTNKGRIKYDEDQFVFVSSDKKETILYGDLDISKLKNLEIIEEVDNNDDSKKDKTSISQIKLLNSFGRNKFTFYYFGDKVLKTFASAFKLKNEDEKKQESEWMEEGRIYSHLIDSSNFFRSLTLNDLRNNVELTEGELTINKISIFEPPTNSDVKSLINNDKNLEAELIELLEIQKNELILEKISRMNQVEEIFKSLRTIDTSNFETQIDTISQAITAFRLKELTNENYSILSVDNDQLSYNSKDLSQSYSLAGLSDDQKKLVKTFVENSNNVYRELIQYKYQLKYSTDSSKSTIEQNQYRRILEENVTEKINQKEDLQSYNFSEVEKNIIIKIVLTNFLANKSLDKDSLQSEIQQSIIPNTYSLSEEEIVSISTSLAELDINDQQITTQANQNLDIEKTIESIFDSNKLQADEETIKIVTDWTKEESKKSLFAHFNNTKKPFTKAELYNEFIGLFKNKLKTIQEDNNLKEILKETNKITLYSPIEVKEIVQRHEALYKSMRFQSLYSNYKIEPDDNKFQELQALFIEIKKNLEKSKDTSLVSLSLEKPDNLEVVSNLLTAFISEYQIMDNILEIIKSKVKNEKDHSVLLLIDSKDKAVGSIPLIDIGEKGFPSEFSLNLTFKNAGTKYQTELKKILGIGSKDSEESNSKFDVISLLSPQILFNYQDLVSKFKGDLDLTEKEFRSNAAELKVVEDENYDGVLTDHPRRVELIQDIISINSIKDRIHIDSDEVVNLNYYIGNMNYSSQNTSSRVGFFTPDPEQNNILSNSFGINTNSNLDTNTIYQLLQNIDYQTNFRHGVNKYHSEISLDDFERLFGISLQN